MDRILKYHIGFSIFFLVVAAIVLFFVYITAVSIAMGIEELLLTGDMWFFGAAVFMGCMYGFVAVVVGYQVLYQFIMTYLDERTLKVPDDCPNCEEKLDSDKVKWIEEEDRAECPQCGEELKVTKVWE